MPGRFNLPVITIPDTNAPATGDPAVWRDAERRAAREQSRFGQPLEIPGYATVPAESVYAGELPRFDLNTGVVGPKRNGFGLVVVAAAVLLLWKG